MMEIKSIIHYVNIHWMALKYIKSREMRTVGRARRERKRG